MALGNRRSADIFNKNTGDNADAKSITSAKELEIKADFEAGVHIADEGMFNNMAPALYAVQQVAEDIEELRRFVGAEVDATPSWVPSTNPNYLTSSSTQTKYLRSDADDTATGYLTLSGGVTGSNSLMTSFFLPQNPEGSHVKAPWFFNDMAYARLRGATITVTVNGGSSPGNADIDKMFDAATGFWNMPTSGITSVVIEMTNPPKTMQYGAHYGVTFGNTNWRANSVDIEAYYSSAYQEVVSTTSNSKEFVYGSLNSSGNSVSKIKWTFSNFNTTSMRIVSLFAYNYNATGMPSLYLAKDGGEMYGDIDMGTNTITDTKVGQWDTAYGWGDHSGAGYLTSSSTQSKYLRSDAVDYFTGKLNWDGADYADGINMSLGNIRDVHKIYANEYFQRASGIARNNLGDPTVTEMALFEEQFKPQTTLANDYDDLTDLTFWSQETSSSDWVEVTSYSDDQKRKFLRTNSSSIIIPNTYYKFRVEFKARAYTFANAMYMYWSSQSHRSQVHVWKKRCSDGTWIQHTSSTNIISSWPGHGYLPFSKIPWNETNTTSTGHFTHIRFEFIPTWMPYSGSGTDYSTRNINLYGMQIWGGYPSGRRTPHYYDQNGEFNFLKDAHILDNNKLYIGTGNDLQLYHDGSNSYIVDAGTGDLLNYFSNEWKVIKYGSSETCIEATSDGSVDLYYDNSKKFETTSSGIDVTGNITASGTATIDSQITTNYGVKFTGGATDFLLYNNAGENVIYMRDTTNGAMITTWHTDKFEVNKNLDARDGVDVTGNITVTGTVDGRDIAADGTKLDTIATNADVTPSWVPSSDPSYLTAETNSFLGDGGNLTTTPGYNKLIYTGQVSNGVSGLFPASDNSNSIITLNRHSGNYDSQLGFSSNGNVYYRKFSGTAINTTQGWGQLLITDTNGNIVPPGAVDGVDIAARDAVLTSTTTTANAALPKAGGTMTGQLAVTHNGGTLNLVGTDHTYIQWYPAGLGGGRHAYTGFAGGGTDHFTIANETSGAHINLTTNSGTVNVTGNLGVTGTVDGRDVATDGTKLDTISTNADVTPSWVPSSDPGYGTSNLALGTTSSTALAGNTTTISTAQANAITANTAKRDARYIYVPVVCNFYGDLSTGEYHVPFSDGETESTSTTNRRNQFVAPCDGHFHKVIVRSNNSTLERGSATDLTIKSKKVVAGTASVTTLETKVVDTVAAETKMVTTFDSTNSAFDEGDRLLLSMQLTDGFPRGSKSYFVTVVFKIDQSDLD